ncbi:LLM class flavin-dependent oxidoreductase [Actinocorallia sp. A-T 12471]|uniref:LLM class flavin-dependent oxidoreductase n=1 Tax=Actinocorallia sp. A-T 12471 TaxID=3089813 RepID=UPI0029D163A8|nr:LLM class flavin-dependent oxidoreductase [Actinocorallia sp. A-T 12471]MDX6741521.1 LLM class flavin-dependent oxidoreductase [Actinocorallia sp. A-T 12471]
MVDLYWRLHMEGDQTSLHRRVNSRGGFAPDAPGRIAPGVRDGAPDGFTHLDYLAEVALATEDAGLVGGLMPSFPHTDDPWAAAASLAAETSAYRFMIAFQPGFLHPVQAARMTATLQRATGGRVVFNIISGGGGPSQLWWGDRVDHDDRYDRTAEFLDVLKGVWHGPFDHKGRFYQVENAKLPDWLSGQPFPEIFFSGSSPAAIAAAGRHADQYLSWLEPFDALAEKFALVRAHSATPPKFAVRVDVLARETEDEAWEEIRHGWAARAARETEHGDSVGVQRGESFLAGAGDGFRDREVQPNVWGGFSELRDGPAFGLVGSYAQVAARIDELLALGVDSLILAGMPHLEEARRIGAHVLPLLKGHLS